MKIFSYIRSHAVLSSGIAIVAVISMIVAGRMAGRNKVVDNSQSNIKKVSLVSVSDFRNNQSKVSADGIVESVSQVDLKSQISAPISVVNVSVGDSVSVGQTIAVLQNADIKAQLDQARAGLQLAQGQYSSTGASLESARKNSLETLRSSYLTADEIINIKIAQSLYESTGGSPTLSSFISDRKLSESIRDKYLALKSGFTDWKANIDSLTINSKNSEVEAVISLSQTNLNKINSLLDDISLSLNDAVKGIKDPGTYAVFASWQSMVNEARSSANTANKSLTSTESGLSSSAAQISSAQAIVRNLEAQFAKTIITSPISGKIASLPLRTGELAQPGQLIATVVGGGGLQIKAYASGEDFSRIKNGAKVLIQGKITGTVVNVAPSVNVINKKVEVKISVDDSNTNELVVGQNVTLSISTDEQLNNKNNNYSLPIQNVKIIPGDAFVYTLDSESKIVKNPVVLGKVQGDFVEIISGINPDMMIVTPVYEIEEGEKVVVQ